MASFLPQTFGHRPHAADMTKVQDPAALVKAEINCVGGWVGGE